MAVAPVDLVFQALAGPDRPVCSVASGVRPGDPDLRPGAGSAPGLVASTSSQPDDAAPVAVAIIHAVRVSARGPAPARCPQARDADTTGPNDARHSDDLRIQCG